MRAARVSLDLVNDEPAVVAWTRLLSLPRPRRGFSLAWGCCTLASVPARGDRVGTRRLGIDPARLWLGDWVRGAHSADRRAQAAVASFECFYPRRPASWWPRCGRVRRLGAAVADGVLRTGCCRDRRQQRAAGAGGGRGAGAPGAVVASYVRVAVGAGAGRRLREEEPSIARSTRAIGNMSQHGRPARQRGNRSLAAIRCPGGRSDPLPICARLADRAVPARADASLLSAVAVAAAQWIRRPTLVSSLPSSWRPVRSRAIAERPAYTRGSERRRPESRTSASDQRQVDPLLRPGK